MTVPAWQPGTLYLPGAFAQPTTRPPSVPATLVNGDFESGDSDWTKGTGFSITTGSAFSGSYSAKYSGSPHTSAFIEQDAYVAVMPGDSVSATCMVKQGASSAGDAGGSVWVRWYDASHVLLSGSEGNVIDSGSGGEWKRSSVTASAPGSAAYFRVAGKCYLNGSGQPLWLDKFTVSYTPRATTGTGLVYKATQTDPATSAGVEPVWPDTIGGTVVDGGVTWEAVGSGYVTWEAHALMVSGSSEPAWPTQEGAVITDGTLEWEAVSTRITDVNCPNTKVVAIAASKVFAVDRDVVRFCATTNPLDWTTAEDAGYLPTGLRQGNANDMAVLQPYRSNLAAWNANGFQLWQVDPDPAQMAILDQMDGIGSTEQRAAVAVANDLLFLSQLGVRSVGIANAAENLASGDVGAPIDILVREAMAVTGARAIGTYYPGAGQFWMAIAASTPYEMTIEGDLGDSYVGDTGYYRYTVKGGTAPVTCAVTAGALPDGATLDDTGLVTYDYTTDGSFTWTVTATDADGNTAHVDDAAQIVTQVMPAQQVWRYLQIDAADATDYSGAAFDDSGWATATAPFGGWEAGYGPTQIAQGAPTGYTGATAYDARFATTFGHAWDTNTRLWLRRTLTLASVPTGGINLKAFIEDNFHVYVNGTLIVTSPSDPPGGNGQVFNVAAPGLIVGDNIIAIRCDDEAVGAGTSLVYVDMLMETE